MWDQVILVAVSALCSAPLTLLLVFLISRRYVRENLQKEMDRLGAEFEARVKAGALEAGEELLPQFREAVAQGFTDALRDLPANKIRTLAETTSNLLEEGLNTILGTGRKPGR